MKTTNRNCQRCGTGFAASNKELKRGNAKFCSMSCSSRGRRMRAIVMVDLICDSPLCGSIFQRPKSHDTRLKSKSGLVFCSNPCKDAAQSLEVGLIPLPHYRDGQASYRKRKLRQGITACELCGWDKEPAVFEVHHVDRDRSNNVVNNLLAICPNCHQLEHYRARDGRYKKNNGDVAQL